MHINLLIIISLKPFDAFFFQPSYKSADVPFRTLKSMSKTIVKKVLPDAKVHKVSLHQGRPGPLRSLHGWAGSTNSV